MCKKKITPHERRVLHDETSFISTPFFMKKKFFQILRPLLYTFSLVVNGWVNILIIHTLIHHASREMYK